MADDLIFIHEVDGVRMAQVTQASLDETWSARGWRAATPDEIAGYATRTTSTGGGEPGAPGASAYAIWLAAGNTGTVNDFLASLKGDPGDPGSGSGVPATGLPPVTVDPATGEISVAVGTTAGTVAAGDDARLTNARTPTDNSVTAAKLVDGSVSTPKLADGSVTNVKVASGIDGAKVTGQGGLVIATSSDVKAQIAQLDAAAAAGPAGFTVGGVLTGTLPAPGLAASSVGDAQVDAGSPITEAKLSLASDAIAATPSRRQDIRRVSVGFWRTDPFGSPVTPTALSASFVNLLLFSPLWVVTKETYDMLAFYTTVGGDAGAIHRMGLYSDTGQGKPASLIYDGGLKPVGGSAARTQYVPATDHDQAWATVAGLTSAANPGQCAAGLYWLAYVLQATPTTYPTVHLATNNLPCIGESSAPQGIAGWAQAGVTGLLPAVATPTLTTVRMALGARVGSRP